MPTDHPAKLDAPFTVLVLGGYGNFGTIICERLCGIHGIKTIVAGRDLGKSKALADRIGASSIALDIDQSNLTESIKSIGTHLVISTVGPFQQQDYRVAKAAIEAGAHYVDLADARSFVCGITSLDDSARQKDVLIASGASSVPALASAVVDIAQSKFSRLDSIHHGISSSEKTPGVATVAAVLGYCGKPIQQWRDRQWVTAYGWQDLFAHDFPEPLGRRRMANCDIPDLDLFPARYPSIATARFSAGVGLSATQIGTWILSWLVRVRLIKDASSLASFLRSAAVCMEPFGDRLSGMFVQLSGIGLDGKPLKWTWDLVAKNNHGPNIPCMAAVALARKLASGTLSSRGARPCIGMITLDEYLAELQEFDISISERSWTT